MGEQTKFEGSKKCLLKFNTCTLPGSLTHDVVTYVKPETNLLEQLEGSVPVTCVKLLHMLKLRDTGKFSPQHYLVSF